MMSKKIDKIVKKINKELKKNPAKITKPPIGSSTLQAGVPAGLQSTPEKEYERVLISHQGEVIETRITDRTTDGKYTKIGGEWKLTENIVIVHKF